MTAVVGARRRDGQMTREKRPRWAENALAFWGLDELPADLQKVAEGLEAFARRRGFLEPSEQVEALGERLCRQLCLAEFVQRQLILTSAGITPGDSDVLSTLHTLWKKGKWGELERELGRLEAQNEGAVRRFRAAARRRRESRGG
jgi:hypothetical protein